MESGETIEVVEGGRGVGVVSLQPLLSSLLLLHLNIRKTPAGLRAGHTSMYVCLSMCVCVSAFSIYQSIKIATHIYTNVGARTAEVASSGSRHGALPSSNIDGKHGSKVAAAGMAGAKKTDAKPTRQENIAAAFAAQCQD